MLLFKLFYHINSLFHILLLKCMYGNSLQIGRHVHFRKGFTLLLDNGAEVSIGPGCFFNNYCSIVSHDKVVIGGGTIMGEGVKIYDHNHCYADVTIPIKEQGYTSKPICIGQHCWIGSNVMILKGSTIGDNCVIGAGCIIHGNIPNNTVLMNRQDLLVRKV